MWVSREMEEKKNVKICFAASSGGHYEQLMMLKPLMEKYDSFVITEKTDYSAEAKGEKTYYMKQVNRREKDFIWRMIQNAWKSIGIYRKEKPDVVICTGVLAMIPICLISKFMGKKLIYIESFAKVTSPTETGKLLYKFADGVVFVHVITLGSDGRARGRIAHFDGAAGFLVHPVQIGLGVRNFRLNLKNVCTDSIGKIFSNLCGNAAGGEVSNKSFAHDKCTSFD